MKKLFTLMLAVLMVAALAVSASASDAAYTSTYATTAPEIDGTIDAIWDTVEWTTISNRSGGTVAAPKFKIMNTETTIYFLGQFADNNSDIDPNEHFGIGLIGANGACTACDGARQSGNTPGTSCSTHKEVCLHLTSCVHTFQGSWCGNDPEYLTYADVTDGTTYTFEAAIDITNAAFSAMTMIGTIGLEVEYKDYTAKNTYSEHFVWAGNVGGQWDVANKNTADFGTLVLAVKPEGGDVTPPAEDDTTPPADSDNTPADTTKPVETPTTDKVPTTADAGLAIAAVVMAAAAMVVLKKKH